MLIAPDQICVTQSQHWGRPHRNIPHGIRRFHRHGSWIARRIHLRFALPEPLWRNRSRQSVGRSAVRLRRLIMVVGCGGVVLCAVELDIRCTCHTDRIAKGGPWTGRRGSDQLLVMPLGFNSVPGRLQRMPMCSQCHIRLCWAGPPQSDTASNRLVARMRRLPVVILCTMPASSPSTPCSAACPSCARSARPRRPAPTRASARSSSSTIFTASTRPSRTPSSPTSRTGPSPIGATTENPPSRPTCPCSPAARSSAWASSCGPEPSASCCFGPPRASRCLHGRGTRRWTPSPRGPGRRPPRAAGGRRGRGRARGPLCHHPRPSRRPGGGDGKEARALGLGRGDLQGGERAAGVALGQRGDGVQRLVLGREGAGEALGGLEGPEQHALRAFGRAEQAHAEDLAAGEQGRVHREGGVLGGGADEGDVPLHVGEEGVLLGLVEAVDLVDEEEVRLPS